VEGRPGTTMIRSCLWERYSDASRSTRSMRATPRNHGQSAKARKYSNPRLTRGTTISKAIPPGNPALTQMRQNG